MIIISNSSPLIALGRIGELDILKSLFGEVLIPKSVYQETVVEANVKIQRNNINKAIDDGYIKVLESKSNRVFTKNLGRGETGVLNLAVEKNPDLLIIDDKKARNEAKELGFQAVFTTDILKEAHNHGLIDSYQDTLNKLFNLQIYLPE